MSAIYQRARPTTFAEVVGQDHVKDVLGASIARGRTGHAYLFSGPRGVGKTTTARLLAMALNCEAEDAAARPCGRCDSCRLVQAGNHPDVTELDAASNNSVEDVRELREKVRLASLRGGTRVWILDEAHMLSRAAANALLKTLEEPPPGLAFVLATTEPEKLPPTVLSRCQHFRFRRLSEREIGGKLARLCREAGVEADDDAVALVARAADGAMRDGESLLERLLASGERVTRAAAEAALGLPPRDRLAALGAALGRGDLAAMFAAAEALYRDGFAPRTLAEQLTRHLQDVLVGRVVGDAGEAGDTDLDDAALLRLVHALDDEAERFVRRDDLYALEAALVKGVNAVRGFAPVAPGDAALPRDASVAAAPATNAASAPSGSNGSGSTERAAAGNGGLPDFDPHAGGGRERPPQRAGGATARSADGDAESAGAAEAAAAAEPRRVDMRAVKSRASAQLKAFLMPARDAVEDDRLTLRYGDRHAFHFKELKKREGELLELLAEVAGGPVGVTVVGPDETLRWGAPVPGGGAAGKA